VSLTSHLIAGYFGVAGSRPGRRIPFGGRQKESKTSLNVHVRQGVPPHSARCVQQRWTKTKYCSIRARASRPGPRSTLNGRSAMAPMERNAAPCGRRCGCALGCGSRGESEFRCRCGSGMRREFPLGLSECLVHPSSDARARMGQPYGAVPPAGEHTVSKAIAVGRTDERLVLKTFFIPFGVYQKEFACRGETRQRASTRQSNPALGHNA
jgi:hypothetical protein